MSWAVSNLTLYGAPILVFLSYIGSLGIPFPMTMVIVAAGALTRTGYLDWWVAMLACLGGAALADNSEYLLGRLSKPWLRKRFEQKNTWSKALSAVNRQGGWAILLTRFWLTPLAPAVNVIAGSRYPLLQFLLFDIAGQLLWVVLYGGLGYLFAAQWEGVSQWLGVFSWISVAVALLAYAVLFVIKRRNRKVTNG